MKCFFIAPIGSESSTERRLTDGLFDEVINPVLTELKYTVLVPHRIGEAGLITSQIIDHLLNDDLVIADLTGLNPNVMYELAIRHACTKPVITIADDGTKLPFDIQNFRTIFYTNDIKGVTQLKENLRTCIKETTKVGGKSDNPISTVIKESLIKKEVKQASLESYIVDSLQSLQRQLEIIRRERTASTSWIDPYKSGSQSWPPNISAIGGTEYVDWEKFNSQFATSIGNGVFAQGKVETSTSTSSTSSPQTISTSRRRRRQ